MGVHFPSDIFLQVAFYVGIIHEHLYQHLNTGNNLVIIQVAGALDHSWPAHKEAFLVEAVE
jgi:hypothetical protein